MADRSVLREFNSRGDAEIVRELLLAHGIETFVVSDDCGSVDPALAFGRGVQLLADTGDLEEAVRILADVEGAA